MEVLNSIISDIEVLQLLIGLAIFLFGMSLLGEGLEKQSGGSLSKVLSNLTSNPFKGLLLGLGVTAVIQSSSATTVMVVGFVNSGIMAFEQSIGIIMGANIGTTVTAWLLSLTGLEGNGLVAMLKPANFTPILAVIGIIMYMGKHQKRKDIGFLMLAFSILMQGMELMSGSVTALEDNADFGNLFIMFGKNPILGVIVGAVVTGIIQSSSASVGILQALSSTGKITFGAAIPIILGQNIGTCVTALISSVGANKAAKRVGIVHLCFNIIGTVVFLSAFYAINAFFPWQFLGDSVDEMKIAIVHTVFNIAATALLFPMRGLLTKLAYLIVPEAKTEEKTELLDERFLSTPSVAVERCREVSLGMADAAKKALELSLNLFNKYDDATAEKVLEYEALTDKYEDKLATFLLRISEKPLTNEDSKKVSLILHAIGDWERIGDHCTNLLDSAKELNTKGISFSKDARKDIEVIKAALLEVIEITVAAFENEDYNAVRQVEPLEEVIDKLRYQLKERHVTRLKEGNCSVETGFVFSDMLTSIERISDHCANIAVAMYELSSENSFERHEHWSNTPVRYDFENEFKQYSLKYSLD